MIVKELKLNVITPSGNRHLVGALQSIGRNNARSKYEEILKAKILKQIGFNDIQKINREMKRIDEVLNLYGARIINLRRKIIVSLIKTEYRFLNCVNQCRNKESLMMKSSFN